jgi:hypothetical protein
MQNTEVRRRRGLYCTNPAGVYRPAIEPGLLRITTQVLPADDPQRNETAPAKAALSGSQGAVAKPGRCAVLKVP